MANTNKSANTKLEKCICCGDKPDNFYMSKNPLHKFIGVLPYCKNCIESIYDKYYKKYNNEKQAMFYTCRKLDLPFTHSAFEAASSHSMKTGWKIWQSYFKTINSIGKNNNYGVDFDDSDIVDDNTNVNISIEEENNNSDFIVTQEIISKWGRGYNVDEYKFLEEFLFDLETNYECNTPVQLNLFKNIAKTQLQANKMLEQNDIGMYDKLMKTLSTLMGDSNIKPVQETSAGNIDKGSFGVFIKKIEDEEPVPNWEKDLGHIDYLKRYIRVFFFGNLAKALNIKNPWIDEYDEEMRKLTVDVSELEQDEVKDYLGDDNGRV